VTTWDPGTNFAAYAEVEAPDNYDSLEQLQAYRNERLEMYESHVTLFRRLGAPSAGLRVVDIGAGSSAFLYALERAGVLDLGVGVEVSASRHEFAEQWRSDGGFHRVRNVHSDFAELRLEPASFDVVSVIDNTYLLLRPEDEQYPARLFQVAVDALRPNGMLVLAFRNDAPAVAGMPPEGRSFEVELPSSNPFGSARYDQQPSPDRRFLRNESSYRTRAGAERRKVEITEVCDVGALAQELSLAGFTTVTVYGDLTLARFDPEQSPSAMVIAVK
jgi:SAM-dependent methyltransferase